MSREISVRSWGFVRHGNRFGTGNIEKTGSFCRGRGMSWLNFLVEWKIAEIWLQTVTFAQGCTGSSINPSYMFYNSHHQAPDFFSKSQARAKNLKKIVFHFPKTTLYGCYIYSKRFLNYTYPMLIKTNRALKRTVYKPRPLILVVRARTRINLDSSLVKHLPRSYCLHSWA